MLDILKEAGVECDRVVAESGLPRELINDPGGEVTGQLELAFQRAFVSATRNLPGVWLRTGLRYRIMSYGPLGFAVLAAPTVARALLIMDSFQDLTFSLLTYHPEFDDGGLVSIMADEGFVPPELLEFSLERSLGSMHRFLTDMQQQSPRLERIECSLDRPARWSEYEHLLPIPVEFGRSATRWFFEPGVGEQSLPMASPLLEETYEQLCSSIVDQARLDDQIVGRLVDLLVRAQRGFPTVAEAAEALATSERTLHRRLDQQGLSFGQLIDQVRNQRARMLLDGSGLSIARIAEMLDFSEISGFSRAFKRWNGMSPLQFRKRSGR